MKALFLFVLLVMFGCNYQPKIEFYIDGKPFYTSKRCLKSHQETRWHYHYGYNYFRGKFEWHFGPDTETICDKQVIDTIEIKKN